MVILSYEVRPRQALSTRLNIDPSSDVFFPNRGLAEIGSANSTTGIGDCVEVAGELGLDDVFIGVACVGVVDPVREYI